MTTIAAVPAGAATPSASARRPFVVAEMGRPQLREQALGLGRGRGGVERQDRLARVPRGDHRVGERGPGEERGDDRGFVGAGHAR